MLSRNPELGNKLIILNGKNLHVYNPEALDSFHTETKAAHLLKSSESFFFAHNETVLMVYEVQDRDLRPRNIRIFNEPKVFNHSWEVKKLIDLIVYAEDKIVKVQKTDEKESVVFTYEHDQEVTSLLFSQDNKLLFIGDATG